MKNRPFTPIRDGILLDVRATANSSRVGLFGVYVDDHSNHSLRIAVQAPATKGDANKAIIKQLSKICGVPPSRITLIAGGTSRNKHFQVVGDPIALTQAFNLAVSSEFAIAARVAE